MAISVAIALGSPRAANVVLLGALLARQPLVSGDAVRAVLEEMVRDPEVRARNAAALDRGDQAITAVPATA